MTEREKEIVSLLSENPAYTMEQLSKQLKVSRKTVAVCLKSLKEKEKIKRLGSDRKGYWKLS